MVASASLLMMGGLGFGLLRSRPATRPSSTSGVTTAGSNLGIINGGRGGFRGWTRFLLLCCYHLDLLRRRGGRRCGRGSLLCCSGGSDWGGSGSWSRHWPLACSGRCFLVGSRRLGGRLAFATRLRGIVTHDEALTYRRFLCWFVSSRDAKAFL